MSSSDFLAEPLEEKQKAARPRGLIALLCVFALCLAGIIVFLAVSHKSHASQRAAQNVATPSETTTNGIAAGAKSLWAIRGALTEACTCAVPCSCNFGAGPSPHSYCYPFYSYHIREGHYQDIKLDGLHFGSADLGGGRALFIDERADERQREALRLIIARLIIRVPATEAEAKATELAPRIRYTRVRQDYDERSNHLEVAGLGEFSADFIMGLDKSQPVVVRNNTTWRVRDAIKARTSIYEVKSERDTVKTKDTNSNQGEFEYTDQMDFGGPARWNCGACANEQARNNAQQGEQMCGR
ncbi:MAG TPA: DUF1326 domain-containing protein [Pyrinomonadaceae bacterium]